MLEKIERKISSFYNAKPHRLVGQKPVVSFTFDDVPASAIQVGARILEQHNAAGTFYLSSCFADEYNLELQQYRTKDIKTLLDGGHEIGCHTHNHSNIQMLSSTEITQDLKHNKSVLQEHLGDHDLVSFSYPFGCTSITAKRVVGRCFATARGVNPGLNKGFVDLTQLKANAIYSGVMTEARISELIDRNAQKKSWLIFYTHDISNTPTPYGCTTELFEYAVEKATASRAEILCMRNALASASFNIH